MGWTCVVEGRVDDRVSSAGPGLSIEGWVAGQGMYSHCLRACTTWGVAVPGGRGWQPRLHFAGAHFAGARALASPRPPLRRANARVAGSRPWARADSDDARRGRARRHHEHGSTKSNQQKGMREHQEQPTKRDTGASRATNGKGFIREAQRQSATASGRLPRRRLKTSKGRLRLVRIFALLGYTDSIASTPLLSRCKGRQSHSTTTTTTMDDSDHGRRRRRRP